MSTVTKVGDQLCECGMPRDMHGPLEHPFNPVDGIAEWAALNLCAASQGLVMSLDGSGEPWPPEVDAAVRAVLRERIGPNWRPSSYEARARFDDAVREVVAAALDYGAKGGE